jgi:hypothetical protein
MRSNSDIHATYDEGNLVFPGLEESYITGFEGRIRLSGETRNAEAKDFGAPSKVKAPVINAATLLVNAICNEAD